MARVVWALLAIGVMALVWVRSEPSGIVATTPHWTNQLRSAERNYDVNHGTASSAVQQEVTIGWHANALAVIHADQQQYIAQSTNRNGELLLVIGIFLAGDTMLRLRPKPARD